MRNITRQRNGDRQRCKHTECYSQKDSETQGKSKGCIPLETRREREIHQERDKKRHIQTEREKQTATNRHNVIDTDQ